MPDSEDSKFKVLLPVLTKFVADRLNENYDPSDLTFALTLIATEVGLEFTNNSTRFLPLMLRAIASAIDSRLINDSKENSTGEVDEVLPPDATLH